MQELAGSFTDNELAIIRKAKMKVILQYKSHKQHAPGKWDYYFIVTPMEYKQNQRIKIILRNGDIG